MFNFLISSSKNSGYTNKFFAEPYLSFTVASLVLIFSFLLVGLIVYKFKKEYFNKFLYALYGSIFTYIIMTIIYINKIKGEDGLSKEAWFNNIYIFVGIILVLIVAMLLSYLSNKNINDKTKKIIRIIIPTVLILTLLALIIAFSIMISKTGYIRFKKGEYKIKFTAKENQIVLFTIFTILIMFSLSMFYFLTRKKQKVNKTKMMADAAITLSLSFALSYVKIFSLPSGGSITLASVVPLALFAYIYGPKEGLQVGFIYSILQIMQGAYMVHPIQVFLDYFLAFSFIGLAGVFRKINIKKLKFKTRDLNKPLNLSYGIILYSVLRFISSFLSGVFFFGSINANQNLVPKTLKDFILNPAVISYSASYNATIIFSDMLIAVAVAFSIMLSKQIQNIVDKRTNSFEENTIIKAN